VACVTGSAEQVAAVRTTKQFLTYVASGPFQYAVAEAPTLPDAYYAAFRDDLRTKRDLLADGLTDAGFQVHAPQGTYFITTDIAERCVGVSGPPELDHRRIERDVHVELLLPGHHPCTSLMSLIQAVVTCSSYLELRGSRCARLRA
jgi:aspartate/methionine/tyrosine aminotransferase